ncbi:MAG: hypothetical protein KDA32_12725 [Phycisphaerales bacterium]|nr:hypothetical protein [Phycisphaerales bacterium]
MRLRAEEGSVYRLVVSLDEREMVYGPRSYSGFSEAQADVADAVRAGARLGDVRYVRLERADAAITAKSLPEDADWRESKRWNGPVVARVLAQAELATGTTAGSAALPASLTTLPFKPTESSAIPAPRPYRTNRWDFAVVTAFVVVSIAVLAWVQFGSGRDAALAATPSAHMNLSFQAEPRQARTSVPRPSSGSQATPAARRRPASQ